MINMLDYHLGPVLYIFPIASVLDAIERGEYGSSPARESTTEREVKAGYQQLNGEPEGGVNTTTSV